MKRHLALALALAAPLLLQGCGGDTPPLKPKPFEYPDRSTPTNTLLRMNVAFERRDSVVTASVYADNYEGTSTDMTDPNSVILTFTKADEVRAIGAMALSNLIIADMEFYSPTSWYQTHYAGDPSGWVTIQIPNFRISITDTNGNGFHVNPAAYETWIFEFTLEPTPDSSSPTDTTWSIVRWTESRISL